MRNTGYAPWVLEGRGGISVSQTGKHVIVSDQGSEAALTQPAFFVDPVTGSDNNRGDTPARALRTVQEFVDRLGQGEINIEMTLNLVGNFDLNNPVRLVGLRIGTNGRLIVRGTRTLLYSGTITLVTVIDRPTNQAWEIADAAIPGSWTGSGLLNTNTSGARRIRGTSGAINGATSWAVLDLGAGRARISPFKTDSAPPVGNQTPAIGNTFVVESLTTIADFEIDIIASAFSPVGAPGHKVRVFDVQLDSTSSNHPSVRALPYTQDTPIVYFYGCEVGELTYGYGSVGGTMACKFCGSGADPQPGGQTASNMFAAAVFNQLQVVAGDRVSIDLDTIFQGAGIFVDGGELVASRVGIFDAPADALLVHAGQWVSRTVFLAHHLYGQGSVGFGVNNKSCTTGVYVTTKPTLTGGAGDTSIGGAVTAWGAVPATTAAELAAIRLQL